MNFGSIIDGLAAVGAVIAIIAGGKIRIVLGFASFVARMVGRFFDSETARQNAEWQNISDASSWHASGGCTSCNTKPCVCGTRKVGQ